MIVLCLIYIGKKDIPHVKSFVIGVLVFLNLSHFSPELKETGSLGATESEV